MNQIEINEWLDFLPYFSSKDNFMVRCKNDGERIKVIDDLLRWANKDRMSVEDREICVYAIALLKARQPHTP